MIGKYGWVRPSRRQRAGSIFWSLVAIAFGWTVFAFWWGEVLGVDQPRALWDLLLAVALFVVALLGGTALWIGHNRRIAAHGSRGLATRYQVPVFERDSLGRMLALPALPALQGAAVVTIDATVESKTYSVEDGAADEAA